MFCSSAIPGGMPISVAAELVPEGVIQSILYLDAFFPEDGESLNDLVPGPPHLPDDPNDYLVPPPRVTAVGFNAHLSPEDRAAYEAIRSPQSVSLLHGEGAPDRRARSHPAQDVCARHWLQKRYLYEGGRETSQSVRAGA